jgi:hypothetical protein
VPILLLASVIAVNSAPAPGQIGAHYFESLKQSQVWVNVQPQSVEPGPNPLDLNITISFPGTQLADTPATVDLRVQARCLVFPTRIRRPALTLIVDGAELRTTGQELPVHVSSACGDDAGTADVITTRVPYAVFRQIAAARELEIRALGFVVRLTPAQRRALTSFANAVAGGVTVGQ